MPTPRFSIRVDPAELKRWKKAAKAEGLDVSAWIRSRCSPPSGSGTIVVDTGHSAKPATTSKASVCPPHPKGARTVLNGGLVRCGACGELVK